MKKFLLLAGVACLFSAAAQAEVNQYVSGKVSYDFNKVSMKEAFADEPEVGHMKYNKELFLKIINCLFKSNYISNYHFIFKFPIS